MRRRRTVQHEAIETLDAEVLERARERLLDLGGDRRVGVVGQPVVLASAIRELGLEEELVAREARLRQSRAPTPAS